jgi:hypothetical protein
MDSPAADADDMVEDTQKIPAILRVAKNFTLLVSTTGYVPDRTRVVEPQWSAHP